MSNTRSRLSSSFEYRHIGPREKDVQEMLALLGYDSLDSLIDAAVPESIRFRKDLDLEAPRSEHEVLRDLRELAEENETRRSFIGMGYAGCLTPPAIQRAVLENPGWYTAYTPYQAEISQGRLEALLNFQTMVSDLTGLPVANASLLDEGTAAAEGMAFCRRVSKQKPLGNTFFVSHLCHPQTLSLLRTRARAAGIEVVVGDLRGFEFTEEVFGCLIQYPASDGRVVDYESFCESAHRSGATVVVATDLLALTLLRAPGDFGADIVVGNSQRFGVPLGFGGPHAGFMSCRDAYRRQMPGRLVGVSKDAEGRSAIRMALQTREQHIRRDKATSNICTAQVLLAVAASMYAVYHGPEGLREIARRVRAYTMELAEHLRTHGFSLGDNPFFDTLRIPAGSHDAQAILDRAESHRINLRIYENRDLGVSLDETVTTADLLDLIEIFTGTRPKGGEQALTASIDAIDPEFGELFARRSDFLTHEVFHAYHSETEFMRYAHRLEVKDLALNTSMIPLGSCTMKLNAAAEMYPISFEGFAGLHPFAPAAQARGYQRLFDRLERWLAEITGFSGVTLMPNSGAQGEYTGLLLIRAWHESRGQEQRDVCLIPMSAHGTNPASAVMAGMKVVVVQCDDEGNVDVDDLRAKSELHADRLAALMITYPSTHGVFETTIREICESVHQHGGQVYLDGANMNALVGLCRPGDFGADVIHLNLHKTFAIPHGGGGPGVGPVAAAKHLVPFLPRHPLSKVGGPQGIGPVSSAAHGSAGVLPISYAYIAMLGAEGLRNSARMAILGANYIAGRLAPHYPLLYLGPAGCVAHECILDLRPAQKAAGITVEDVAKRLMDYGFHAPTMSWPVAGTLMVEPTESESKEELDRFCDAMISIREEIREVEEDRMDRSNNPLKNAPHTMLAVTAEEWDRPYTRERAAFPAPWTRRHKHWPAVARVDNAWGDRHLVCTCPPMEAYVEV